MRHPFDGILPAGEATSVERSQLIRRTFLRRTLTGAAGLVAVLFGAGRQTQGQSPIGQSSMSRRRYPDVTTQALGEEAGSYPPPRYRQPVTTYALGEESGRWYPRPPSYWRPRPPQRYPYRYTTFALGEEAGTFPPWRHSW